MVGYDPKQWHVLLLRFNGTILPRVLLRVLLLAAWSLMLWQLMLRFEMKSLNTLGHSVMGVAVGLLIVFRNTTSYDRYWEGRKLWGGIVNASRNLVREGAAYSGDARDLGQLAAAYALALKQHLRGNTDLAEVQAKVPADVFARISATANPPSALAFEMSAWIHRRLADGRLEPNLARVLEGHVSTLLDCQGGCERILRTPIPFAYAVHIKQLLYLYLLTLPLVVAIDLGWMVAPVVGIIGFGMLGIEEAGVEIEDPFGDDPNDLPIEAICATIERDTTALSEMRK